MLRVWELVHSWVGTAACTQVSADYVLDVNGDHRPVFYKHVVQATARLGVSPLVGKVKTGFLDVGAGQGDTCWALGCRDVDLHAFSGHEFEASARAVRVDGEEEQVRKALVKFARANRLDVEHVVPCGKLSVTRGEVSVHNLVSVKRTAVAGCNTPVHAARWGTTNKLVRESELGGGHITDTADNAGADRDGEGCLGDSGEVVDITSVCDPQDVGTSGNHRRARNVDVVGEVVLFRVATAAKGLVSVADVHGVHVHT